MSPSNTSSLPRSDAATDTIGVPGTRSVQRRRPRSSNAATPPSAIGITARVSPVPAAADTIGAGPRSPSYPDSTLQITVPSAATRDSSPASSRTNSPPRPSDAENTATGARGQRNATSPVPSAANRRNRPSVTATITAPSCSSAVTGGDGSGRCHNSPPTVLACPIDPEAVIEYTRPWPSISTKRAPGSINRSTDTFVPTPRTPPPLASRRTTGDPVPGDGRTSHRDGDSVSRPAGRRTAVVADATTTPSGPYRRTSLSSVASATSHVPSCSTPHAGRVTAPGVTPSQRSSR